MPTGLDLRSIPFYEQQTLEAAREDSGVTGIPLRDVIFVAPAYRKSQPVVNSDLPRDLAPARVASAPVESD